MTQNKRRKNKTRNQMAATGTNYVRAARASGSKGLKDTATLSWSPGTLLGLQEGINAVDSPLHADSPHLLITGMSASEPEAMLSDMVQQIMKSNTPEDVQFRIIEPTSLLSQYRTEPHVSHYVDSWTPSPSFMPNTTAMINDLTAEMERRYAVMLNHAPGIYNLGKGRETAMNESSNNGTPLSEHPLWMPYIFVVINECSALFTRNGKDEQNQITSSLSQLTRKSRAAGIFLVMSTNFAMAIPSVIRGHLRTIAFTVSNDLFSHAVMGDETLHDLPLTQGAIVGMKGAPHQVFERHQDNLPVPLR